MTVKNCAVILLAGGLSKRFGAENKLLASLNGKAVIDHTLTQISPVGFGLHFAVTGPLSDMNADLHHKLNQAGYIILVNSLPEKGQGRSLALGAQAVIAAGFERACIALADMPLIPSEYFTSLLELAETSDQVVSETQTDNGLIILPPCVFTGQALQRLTRASGDSGAKRYLRGKDVARHQISAWSARDIDTLDDLQTAEHDLKLMQIHVRRMKPDAK